MKQFLTVLKFEMNNYFKNKSFVLTTVLLAVLGALVIAVPPMIPGLLDKGPAKGSQDTAVVQEKEPDLEPLGIVNEAWEESDLELLKEAYPAEWKTYGSQEELEKAVNGEEVNGGFVVNGENSAVHVVVNNSVTGSPEGDFTTAMVKVQKEKMLAEKGVSPEEIDALDQLSAQVETKILGKNSARNYLYTYILVFVLYFIILFYGQMIAVSVTTEKSNRAIEILVTSVNSNSLIFGKVIAGALSGIIQVAVIVAACCGTYAIFRDAWGNMLDMLFYIPANVLAAYAVFAILGYLLYALIYGALGALVSKTEDISKSASLITMVYVVAFFIAIFGMSNSDSLLMKVTSFIPFTAHNSMFIRIAMGSVAWWEIALSLLILAASCVVTGILAAKLFRFGTLHYGNPIKFSNALKGMKNHK
ncbi:MAG: ABC transporter permease [Blautia sp.]|jgi:ABC-2 type transport system permease protein